MCWSCKKLKELHQAEEGGGIFSFVISVGVALVLGGIVLAFININDESVTLNRWLPVAVCLATGVIAIIIGFLFSRKELEARRKQLNEINPAGISFEEHPDIDLARKKVEKVVFG